MRSVYKDFKIESLKNNMKKNKITVKKTKARKTGDKITKDMSVASVIKKYPQTLEVFFDYGLHCVGCAAAEFDTIESGAKAHGINVEHLLHDLNNKIK